VEVFRLHTLGGAFLARASGEALGGAAAQRRTVALLALLAAAGDAGLSRDKIVGVLWPDTDTERARHSLTQALYAARRALQAEDLFLVGADIRLNRDRLTSDVGDFDALIAAGELERAVSLYRGPFLDGFFVSGASEFERWSSAQRERLEGALADALRRLAARAQESHDYRAEAEWRRRLAGLLPLDSGVAMQLMTALANAGDRAGAVQHAQVHAALLREEMDLDPDPAVEALASKLKDPGAAVPIAAPAPVVERLMQPRIATSAGPPRASVGVWTRAPRRHRWLGASLLAAVAIGLVGAGVLIERARRPSVVLRDLAPRQRVVVAPFRVVGAAAGLDYLRDGIVELLSTRLADDTAARSVDAGGVLTAWHATGLADAATVPRDTVVDLAKRLGAERVVIGSVVGSAMRLAITAAVYAVPSGAARGEATVSGPVDSLTTLIDRLAARLLVADAGEDERLATYTSESLPALRAFLSGQAAFRRNDFESALRQYDLALRRDSSFALAALYRALAADALNDEPQLSVAIAVAWDARPALNDRDRSVLAAFAGSRYPVPPSASDLVTAWQRVVDLAPTSAEAWSLLGARLLHDGAAAGLASPLRRAANAYERALAMNPGYVPAWKALVQLGALSPDSPSDVLASADSTPAQREAASGLTPFVRWRSTITSNDTLALRQFRDTLSSLRPLTLRAIARTSQFDAIGIEDGAHALAVLRQRATRASELASLAIAEHSLAVNRGRPREALALTTRLRRFTPGSHGWLRLRVLDALYAEGDTASASAAARELADLVGAGRSIASTSSETWLADACVLAQWRLSRGDTTGVRGAISALTSAPARVTTPVLVRTQPNACAELLDASLAVATGAPDAAARLQRLDSMVFTPQVAGDAVAYAPILAARLYERRGAPVLALRAIRRRTYMSGWPRYLANAWAMEARLATQVGDSTGAMTAYRRFLALRDSPEDALVPQVESARHMLALSPPAPRTELPTPR